MFCRGFFWLIPSFNNFDRVQYTTRTTSNGIVFITKWPRFSWHTTKAWTCELTNPLTHGLMRSMRVRTFSSYLNSIHAIALLPRIGLYMMVFFYLLFVMHPKWLQSDVMTYSHSSKREIFQKYQCF